MTQVLLLDDNPAQLKFRELLFRGAGIECLVAQDPVEALTLLENDQVTFRQKPCEPEDLTALVIRAMGNGAEGP